MEHYGTLAPDPLRHELEEHGYKLREHSLMGEGDLRAGDPRRTCPDEEPQEESVRLSASEEESSEQGNLLGEHYERKLDFRLQF